uniref:Uncharacterized protein n=1 Tax=Ganoderma lingzhi TaxID=1233435 RepID=A0A8K1V171_9APHY|nr:hypothetical protein [Ganoderma lingzhi]UDY67716.1 hypothetical protein [Ganoderma lingzhi]UOL49760.1 hypothetical protein [Ganoderma lingzhi]UOL49980.1 hypothetical protein [Ganoderma lingzhi]UOL50233.1 hypothetical protein [Ganoderma lingzhi]
MIFLSILILIVAIALPSINQNIRSILYVRISSIIFIYAGALAFNAFYIQSIGSGIGIYSGLFQVTSISQLFSDNNDQILILSSVFFTNNNNLKKTLQSRVWTSIKAGWNLSILPDHINKLENSLSVRIFKTIGGICVFLIISGVGSNFNKIFLYLIFILSILYIIYKIIITFYVIKHWVHNLRSGKFIVRNSPLDLLGTVLKGGVATLKSVTRFTVGTGMTYALCYELDEILVTEGKQPYFVPRMRELIRSTGLEAPAKTFLDNLGVKDNQEVLESSSLDSFLQQLSPEEKVAFESQSGLKFEDYIKAHKTMMDLKKGVNPFNVSVSSLIDKENPFNNKK